MASSDLAGTRPRNTVSSAAASLKYAAAMRQGSRIACSPPGKGT